MYGVKNPTIRRSITGRWAGELELAAAIRYAEGLGTPVHEWTGTDREDNPMAVVWIAGGRSGAVLSAFEITGR